MVQRHTQKTKNPPSQGCRMPLIHLCFLFRFSSFRGSAPPSSFSVFFLVFRPETNPRFPFFLPVCSRNCLIFARMISTCQISSNPWAPVHRMLHDFPHRWLLLHFGQIKSNYFHLMSFMKANRKQMDLTKCGLLVQQACKTWAQCYCVIQVFSQTCFGWLLSWREPAA